MPLGLPPSLLWPAIAFFFASMGMLHREKHPAFLRLAKSLPEKIGGIVPSLKLCSAMLNSIRAKRILLYAAVIASFSVLVFGLFLGFADKTYTAILPAAEAQPYQGNAFVIRVPQNHFSFIFGRPDSNHDPQASGLVFFVDGKPLAPHQLHADLISGKPGFSHWGNSVIFSIGSADLKDATKEMRIVVPLRVPPYVLWPAIIIFLFSLTRLYREQYLAALRLVNGTSIWIGWAVVVGLSILNISTLWAGYPAIPIVPNDGIGYVTWTPVVPIGYPIFITLIAKTFSSLNAVIIAQVILYCMASICLYWQASKRFISPFAAALTAVLLLGAGRIMSYNLQLTTDGLFAALIIFHMAAVLSIIRAPSTAGLIAAGITIVLAIFIRPAAYFLLGGLFVLLIAMRGHRWRILKVAGSTVAAAMLLMSLTTSAAQGAKNRSILWLALFPHVAHLYEPSKSSADPTIVLAVDQATRDYRTEMRETISRSWSAAFDFELNSFNPVVVTNIYGALFPEGDTSVAKRLKMQEIFKPLAIETILNDPLGYLEIVWINFYGAYTKNVFLVSPPGYESHEGASLRWWFDETRRNALPAIKLLGLPEPDADSLRDVNQSPLLVNPPRHLDLLHHFSPLQKFVALGAGILLVLGLFLSRKKKSVSLWGLYAITLHIGGTLLVCLTTVAIPRYAVPLDALLIIAIGCAADLSGFYVKAWVDNHSMFRSRLAAQGSLKSE
jgi:hypothetical protein